MLLNESVVNLSLIHNLKKRKIYPLSAQFAIVFKRDSGRIPVGAQKSTSCCSPSAKSSDVGVVSSPAVIGRGPAAPASRRRAASAAVDEVVFFFFCQSVSRWRAGRLFGCGAPQPSGRHFKVRLLPVEPVCQTRRSAASQLDVQIKSYSCVPTQTQTHTHR